jgi:Domain of Unknown Function (DUF928)
MKTVVLTFLASLVMLCSLPSQANELELYAMVPDRVGLTVRKSPVLYFFISEATSLPVRFTLKDERSIAPVADILIPSPLRAGFWPIRLKDYNIQLDEDVQYRWYVSVIRDPAQNQLDIMAGGVVEHIDPHLVDYYDQVCDRDSVLLALNAGLWIDGFACLNELIEANPEDQSLRRLREGLVSPNLLNRRMKRTPGINLLERMLS